MTIRCDPPTGPWADRGYDEALAERLAALLVAALQRLEAPSQKGHV